MPRSPESSHVLIRNASVDQVMRDASRLVTLMRRLPTYGVRSRCTNQGFHLTRIPGRRDSPVGVSFGRSVGSDHVEGLERGRQGPSCCIEIGQWGCKKPSLARNFPCPHHRARLPECSFGNTSQDQRYRFRIRAGIRQDGFAEAELDTVATSPEAYISELMFGRAFQLQAVLPTKSHEGKPNKLRLQLLRLDPCQRSLICLWRLSSAVHSSP